MKTITSVFLLSLAFSAMAELPKSHSSLLPFVQAAPDQGETNTCWFVASTGAMELLLNKRDKIINPKAGGPNDLSESFLIWQMDYYDRTNPSKHFIEQVVKKFNYAEAVHIKHWPFNAYYPDGTDSLEVWDKHQNFMELPKIEVPAVETELLFSRGRRWATNVLLPDDILTIKKALVTHQSPIIINYNDDGYWHVVLIVGYDDEIKGECYEVEAEDCNQYGSFYVRDSNGKRFETRAYNWFLYNGNAAAVVKLK